MPSGAGAEVPLLALADAHLGLAMAKIERATAELPDSALWWRANERSNSIANLLLHLRGNLSQWILAALAGDVYDRRRGAEFAAREGASRDELVGALGETVERCRAAIRVLGRDELDRVREVQGYAVDGHGALFHAVEHLSYHAGQIVLLAKQLLPAELELYPQHRDE